MVPLDGRAYTKLFNYVGTNQSSVYSGHTWPVMYYNGDNFFLNGGSSFVPGLISGPMAVSSVLGITKHAEEFVDSKVYLTPKPVTRPFVGREDASRYETPLNRFHLGDASAALKASLLEKQVDHLHFRGLLSDSALITKYEPSTALYGFDGNIQLKPWQGASNGFRATGVNSRGFLTFEEVLVDDQPYSYALNVDAYRDSLAKLNHIRTNEFVRNDSGFTRRWSNGDGSISFADNYYHFDLSYHYQVEWDYRGYGFFFARFKVNLKFFLGFDEAYGSLPAFQKNPISPDVVHFGDSSTVTYVDGFHPDHVVISEPIRVSKYAAVGVESNVCQASTSYYSNFGLYRRWESNSELKRQKAFEQSVLREMSSIRPSAYLAASKSLEDSIQILTFNALQDLQHLRDVLSLIPDLGPLLEIAAKAVAGDPSAVKDLIDFITHVILQYQFSQRPIVKDGKEILATDLKGSLDRLTKVESRTLYGKFAYTFSDSENFVGPGRLELVTRSKIRLHVDMSTLMVSYLCANSLGLLPTLSRIWQVLPFTFVVDWFTNMSKRLRLVDDQVTWLAMRTDWCLYSYKMTYYPSPEELSEYSLVSLDPEEPFGIVLYTREFSRYTPVLRESRFDFLKPTRGPDPVTVGALIWQLVT